MRHFFPLNWIQWMTLALVLTVAVTTPILFLRLEHVQQRIQAERRDSIISSCEDQNRRHNATIHQLNAAGAEAIKKQPNHAAQINQSVDQFRVIFDASTPKRNCQTLANKFVHQGG